MAVIFLFALSALFLNLEVFGDDDNNWKNDPRKNRGFPLKKESPLPNYKESERKLEIPASGSFKILEERSTAENDFRCGGLLDAQPSVNYLKSHARYGEAHYGFNQRCVWTIRAPPGRGIHIRASNIALEPSRRCQYDFLRITYKNGTDYPLWRRICGKQDLVEFTSPENEITIMFHTDSSITSDGFLMSYELH